MSQKKKFWGVVLILTIYVAIAIGGFLVVYFIKQAVTQPQTTPPPKTTPVPAQKGFETYQNTEQKYSLNYPETLQVKEKAVGFGVSTVEFRSETNTDPAYAPEVQILSVPKSIAKAVGQDFEAYLKMADGETKDVKSPLNQDQASERFTKIRAREINGLRAIDYSSRPSTSTTQLPELGTMVEVGDNIIIFASGTDDREQLEEVLKTFTFTK